LEYEHFGIDMSTSRERFDEASRMIIDALETGTIEGDGPWYPQVRTEIRPRPRAGIRDRFYCVGMSPDSVEQCAKLGARLMVFSQQPWELFAQGPLSAYREAFRKHHDGEPPPPLTGDLMFCHEDPAQAEELARKYMANYFLTIVKHYEIMSDHFGSTKGYDSYASAADAFKAVGLEFAARTYCGVNSWGDPERLIAELRKRRELIGDFELNLIVNYGGMDRDESLASLELFAREVLPELHGW
jgi:alkanesulfonate monooxygenase SsuD/methylene tetrahydromethanopterin reductase-like flavin-dependent oxidoreductase (luciferase family)